MNNQRRYRISIPPIATVKVFTVTEVKTAIKAIQEITVEDDFILGLIDAATDWAEKFTNRALLPQTVEMSVAGFPTKCTANPYASLQLFRSPVRKVLAIKYDKQGAETTDAPELLLPAEFREDTIHEPALIFPKDSWPTDAGFYPGAVKVEFEAGYSKPSDIPASLRRAMMIWIADNYEYREDGIQEKTTRAEAMARQHRIELF